MIKIEKVLDKIETVLLILSVAAVFFLILAYTNRGIIDPDIWLHLKTGEVILKTKAIPTKDIFSFTMAGKPWNDHEWLFQVITYIFYQKWQAEGLIFIQAFIITLSFLFLFLIGYRRKKLLLLIILLLLIAVSASRTRFNIRPDIFSFLFFAIFLFILKRGINSRAVYILPLIQMIWVNLHGYFFLGPLVVFIFTASQALKIVAQDNSFLRKLLLWQWSKVYRLTPETYSRLKKVLVLTILACLLNPQFFKGALYPFWVYQEALFGKSKVIFEHIVELYPTLKMRGLFGLAHYKILILFSLLVLAVNFKKLNVADIILFLIFLPLSIIAVRNIAFFAFVAYTIIVSNLENTDEVVNKSKLLPGGLKLKWALMIKICFMLIFISWAYRTVKPLLLEGYYDFDKKSYQSSLTGIIESRFPKKAIDFICTNNLPENMINDFNSGSYLIGNCFPKRKVFIDGRTELYGADFFKNYLKITKTDKEGLNEFVQKYDIQTILWTYTMDSPKDIIKELYASKEWKLIYFDDKAAIFIKQTKENKPIIDKFYIDLEKWIPPSVDAKDLTLATIYPEPYLKRAAIFNLLNLNELAFREAKEALRILPSCAPAYNTIARYYFKHKQFDLALENFRLQEIYGSLDLNNRFELAMAYSELKNFDKAIKELKEIIKIDHQYISAYEKLGDIYKVQNNLKEASNYYNRAVVLDPQNKAIKEKLDQINIATK